MATAQPTLALTTKAKVACKASIARSRARIANARARLDALDIEAERAKLDAQEVGILRWESSVNAATVKKEVARG